MFCSVTLSLMGNVALRKESVDRNFDAMQIVVVIVKSLSARRAWIEIRCAIRPATGRPVALRKESVDRNQVAVHFDTLSACRSPQGERG